MFGSSDESDGSAADMKADPFAIPGSPATAETDKCLDMVWMSIKGKLVKCPRSSTTGVLSGLKLQNLFPESTGKTKTSRKSKVAKTPPKTKANLKKPTKNNEKRSTLDTRRHSPDQCFICNLNFRSYSTKLDHPLGFSNKPLSEMLESLVDTSLDQTTVAKSAVCEDCFTHLENYDEYQQKCKEIQKKIFFSFQQTHTEPVFIKQEPEVWVDESSKDSSLHRDSAPTFKTELFEAESLDDDLEDPDFTDSSENSEDEQKQTKQKKDKKETKKSKSEKPKNMRCDKCKKICKNSKSLEIHNMTEHSEIGVTLECPICSKNCTNKQNFRYHYNTHKKEKHLLCIECGATFDHKYALDVHMRIHNDERPYACEFPNCPKKFRTPSKRKVHHRVHTGEKIFECPFCPDKRFAQSYGRDVHIKKNHKDEELPKESCKICGIEVRTKEKMKIHLRKMHVDVK